LWWNDRSPVHSFEDYDGPLPARLWLDMGTAEGDASLMGTYQVENLRLVRDRALERGMVYADDLGCLEDPGAGHNESAWAGRLDSILIFLLGTERALDLPPTRLDLFLFHSQLVLDSAYTRTTLAAEALHAGRLRLTWPNEMLALESSLVDVASVDVHGNVLAHAAGESSIRASMDDLSASQTLLVSNPSTVRVDLCATLPPGTPDGATIYVTGDQPAWGPWDPAAQALECDAGICQGSLIMPLDTSFSFKFTRGSWETVEKFKDCSEHPNRQAQATGPDFEFTNLIEAWADLCP
jgi:hypothetical protein